VDRLLFSGAQTAEGPVEKKIAREQILLGDLPELSVQILIVSRTGSRNDW